jgi:hypothetical protein
MRQTELSSLEKGTQKLDGTLNHASMSQMELVGAKDAVFVLKGSRTMDRLANDGT